MPAGGASSSYLPGSATRARRRRFMRHRNAGMSMSPIDTPCEISLPAMTHANCRAHSFNAHRPASFAPLMATTFINGDVCRRLDLPTGRSCFLRYLFGTGDSAMPFTISQQSDGRAISAIAHTLAHWLFPAKPVSLGVSVIMPEALFSAAFFRAAPLRSLSR